MVNASQLDRVSYSGIRQYKPSLHPSAILDVLFLTKTERDARTYPMNDRNLGQILTRDGGTGVLQ